MVFFKRAPISHLFADCTRIEEFQKIVKSPLNGRESVLPETSAIVPYALIDMAVFTLGLHENDSVEPVSQPLIDLYQSIMHFATCTEGGVAHVQFERSEHDRQSDQDDPRIPVLHQARHLLDLSHSADPRLAQAVTHLKHLLHQTDLDTFWGSLPGALIWCLVIGARLSPPGSARKWFLMQVVRTGCAIAMSQNSSEMVLECLRTVLAGLGGAETNRSRVAVTDLD